MDPVALAALLEVLLDAALAVLADLGHLGRREEEGQQQRAVPVAAGEVDRHHGETGGSARGVQGAAPDGARGDDGGQRRADGRPDREGGGGDGHGELVGSAAVRDGSRQGGANLVGVGNVGCDL